MTSVRPPGGYLFGDLVVVANGRLAAHLCRLGQLDRHLRENRGRDPELDYLVADLLTAANRWRTAVAGTHRGTNTAEPPEPRPPSAHGLTSGQAADRAGVGPRAIVRAIHEGRLDADLLGGRWLISPTAAADYAARRTA